MLIIHFLRLDWISKDITKSIASLPMIRILEEMRNEPASIQLKLSRNMLMNLLKSVKKRKNTTRAILILTKSCLEKRGSSLPKPLGRERLLTRKVEMMKLQLENLLEQGDIFLLNNFM